MGFKEIFEFCDNVHLELHISHLESRGLDYKELLDLIPWEKVKVMNLQHGHIVDVQKNDDLDGFCSLFITPKINYT